MVGVNKLPIIIVTNIKQISDNKLLIATFNNGIYLADLKKYKSLRISDCFSFFGPISQAIVKMSENIIICKKDEKKFIKIKEEKIIKEIEIETKNGRIYHIKRYNSDNCIISCKEIMLYNIFTDELKKIKSKFDNIVNFYLN